MPGRFSRTGAAQSRIAPPAGAGTIPVGSQSTKGCCAAPGKVIGRARAVRRATAIHAFSRTRLQRVALGRCTADPDLPAGIRSALSPAFRPDSFHDFAPNDPGLQAAPNRCCTCAREKVRRRCQGCEPGRDLHAFPGRGAGVALAERCTADPGSAAPAGIRFRPCPGLQAGLVPHFALGTIRVCSAAPKRCCAAPGKVLGRARLRAATTSRVPERRFPPWRAGPILGRWRNPRSAAAAKRRPGQAFQEGPGQADARQGQTGRIRRRPIRRWRKLLNPVSGRVPPASARRPDTPRGRLDGQTSWHCSRRRTIRGPAGGFLQGPYGTPPRPERGGEGAFEEAPQADYAAKTRFPG